MEQADKQGNPDQAVFYPVSTRKLALMSMFSYLLYLHFWFFANWYYLKRKAGLRVCPFWRSLVLVAFTYPLFHLIADRMEEAGLEPGFRPGRQALLFLLIQYFSMLLPGFLKLFCLFGILAVLPVQAAVNRLNGHLAPGAAPNARFTRLNRLMVLASGLLFGLAALRGLLEALPGTVE
ncbi:hypothetical protein LLH00_06350 [bacterium]|nr:hypothetical protein [bacterium]